MPQIAVDQPRIAHHAAPGVVGHQAAGLAHEQRHAEDLLDFTQGLGRTGLGNGHGLSGLVQ
jgi:hypothetical protein